MSSDQKAKLTLSIALILLLVSGIAASLAIVRLYLAENWVRHTYTVEVALGDLESDLASVGRARVEYVRTGAASSLQDFHDSLNDVSASLASVRKLTSDNPAEQSLCDRLAVNAGRRLAPSNEAVSLKQKNQLDDGKLLQLTSRVAETATETSDIVDQMRRNEDQLLAQRRGLSKSLFVIMACVLATSLILSAVMFWIHYRLLNNELGQRRVAEEHLRQLSVQLMKVQDEQARRFARELHDGIGQGLVAAKMEADSLALNDPTNGRFADLAALLEELVLQTRTVSYLFHPPLLDEMGFGSAAKWFTEGYSQRTGIAVSMGIPKEAEHLPRDLELALFRVLQEALTNTHRHSKSSRAEVSVSVNNQWVTLSVQDFGRGIPAATLANFQNDGADVGVGLAGMKERVREFGGELQIESSGNGTKITVSMPVTPKSESAVRPPASAPILSESR